MNKAEINMKLKITELEMRVEQLEKMLTATSGKEIKPYYSVSEFAKLLDMTTATVYNQCKNGRIHAIKVGGSWRIPHDELM